MAECTAYIDMEFAGIYGTHQAMQIPIEAGVVVHQPGMDEISFMGRAFSRKIDVELWKNVTDDVGKRITGKRRVFNLERPRHSQPFDKKYHLSTEGRKEAHRVTARVYQDLRQFIQMLDHKNIGTLVFFASRREMETFGNAGIRTGSVFIRDLQEEIRSRFHLKEHVSLDRVSLVTRFSITEETICSAHFSYSLPEKYRYLIKPHKAIGDAARIFLADREFHQYPEQFRERLTGHLEEYEQRKTALKSAPDGENERFRPQTM